MQLGFEFEEPEPAPDTTERGASVLEELDRELGCAYAAMASSPIGFYCPHGREVCATCDPCTCGHCEVRE